MAQNHHQENNCAKADISLASGSEIVSFVVADVQKIGIAVL